MALKIKRNGLYIMEDLYFWNLHKSHFVDINFFYRISHWKHVFGPSHIFLNINSAFELCDVFSNRYIATSYIIASKEEIYERRSNCILALFCFYYQGWLTKQIFGHPSIEFLKSDDFIDQSNILTSQLSFLLYYSPHVYQRFGSHTCWKTQNK